MHGSLAEIFTLATGSALAKTFSRGQAHGAPALSRQDTTLKKGYEMSHPDHNQRQIETSSGIL
jgi:hypothetical protein